MNIQILGAHRSESQGKKSVSLLIDGTLAIDAGALTSLSIENQQRIKAILLTHQHYDHIRDIPAIALNLFDSGVSTNVHSTANVRTTIETHLMNETIYPKFHEIPAEQPTISFNLITPYQPLQINGHEILAIPVNHYSTPTLGYQVSNGAGKKMFYTSDTGPGLLNCWNYTSPELLIIDVTFPNSYGGFPPIAGHLTPALLQGELITFREHKGYLPEILIVHMDAMREEEIKKEIASVAEALNASITVAREGMQLSV